jgi:hypothetical protein
MSNGSRQSLTILSARVPLHMHMKLYEHPRGVRGELRWCLASCHGGLSYSLTT